MPGAFTAVDLSRLPFPAVVETLSFDAILAAMLADLIARDATFTALVESDPAFKVLEVAAFRETLLRQRVNEAAKAVTLAHAIGSDLDQIAARYNIARLMLAPGDPDAVPPVAPTYETDVELRRRVQLAFEGLSTAGPRGAYLFHALGADPDVLDAAADSPTPGIVIVSVLSRTGDGTASAELLDAVDATLNADEVRPLTDQVTVQSAEIIEFAIDAELTIFPGPDSAVVVAEALQSVERYVDESHRIGRDVTRSGLFAALHVEGVQNVALVNPAADVVVTASQAPYCTGRAIVVVGVDE